MNYFQELDDLPKTGDILLCNFPDRNFLKYYPEEDLIPFSKQHYCLVLAIDNDLIFIAYGTSKIKKYSKKKHFIIDEQEAINIGLKRSTQWYFSLTNIALLPATTRYFNNNLKYELNETLKEKFKNFIKKDDQNEKLKNVLKFLSEERLLMVPIYKHYFF